MTANEQPKKIIVSRVIDILLNFSTTKNNSNYPANNKIFYFGIDLLHPKEIIQTIKTINFEQLPNYFSNGTNFIPLTQAQLSKLTITIVSNDLDEKKNPIKLIDNYPLCMLIDSTRKGKDFIIQLTNVNIKKSYITMKDNNAVANFGNKTLLIQLYL